jgi:hypothetical protein
MPRAHYGKPKPINLREWRSKKRETDYLAMKAPARVYLKVPFEERHQVARLGGCFDAARKCWYIPKGERLGKFRWRQHAFPPPVRR